MISIHVPAWGTTGNGLDSQKRDIISIHVPAWGTTIIGAKFRNMSGISIHVPAWGTTSHLPANLVHHKFQSTFPRGERQSLPIEMDSMS